MSPWCLKFGIARPIRLCHITVLKHSSRKDHARSDVMMLPQESSESAPADESHVGPASPAEVATDKPARSPPSSTASEYHGINSAALEAYAREQESSANRKGPAVRMSSADGDESFLTSIAGSSGEKTLIIAAPKHADGRLADIQPGQNWVFRTIHHTTALRFDAVIKSVVNDEAPHVYVELSGITERRVIRKTPRVAVVMRATLLLPHVVRALVVDLSAGGARFAIDASVSLEAGQFIVCSTALTIADRLYSLELKAVVLKQEASDPRHPDVALYRMRFESLSDLAFLALQAYLATELVEELDYFWRLVAGPLRR